MAPQVQFADNGTDDAHLSDGLPLRSNDPSRTFRTSNRAFRTSTSVFRMSEIIQDPELGEEDNHNNTDSIDAIFSYLDPLNTGFVTVDDMNKALESIGEEGNHNALSDVLQEGWTRGSTLLSKADFSQVLFQKRERTVLQTLALYTVLWILPAFYSASTRLPFICLAIEVTHERQGELWQVSVLLGAYQACRAIANFIIASFGGADPMRRLHIPMVLMGLIGWTLAGLPQWTSVWALLALMGVGLSESIVNLQTTLLHETRAESVASIADPRLIEQRIRSQYAAVAGGVLLFWLLGGWLYTNKGFQAVTFLGIGCHVAQLVGTLFYRQFGLSVALRKQRNTKTAELATSDGRVFLRSITYRVKAMSILATEAKGVFSGAQNKIPYGLDEAAALAKDDAVLHTSLKMLYRAFFQVDRKQHKSTTKSKRSEAVSQSRTGLRGSLLKVSMTAATVPTNFRRRHTSSKDDADSDSDNTGSMSKSAENLSGMFTNFKRMASKEGFTFSCKQQGSTTVDCAKVAVQLMDISGDGRVSEREFIDYLAPRVYREVFQPESESATLKPVNVVWPYMKAVVFTQAIMALCIGTFLSTALLMYTERFNLTAATVGLLLAIGEGLGAGMIIATSAQQIRSHKKEQEDKAISSRTREPNLWHTIASRPLHVPFMLFLVGAASAGFSCPVFAGAIVCQMGMSMLNDQSVSFLNELIATSIPPKHFRKYQGMGQWLRRLGNVVTGVMGPWMFGINPNLPFLFFGSTVIVWGFVLWFLLYQHGVKIRDEDPAERADLTPTEFMPKPFRPFRETSETPWHVMEQRYYSLNKDEIEEELAPTHAHALNLAVLDFRMRRMGAYQQMLELRLKRESKARKKEFRARKDLEVRFGMLEQLCHDKGMQGMTIPTMHGAHNYDATGDTSSEDYVSDSEIVSLSKDMHDHGDGTSTRFQQGGKDDIEAIFFAQTQKEVANQLPNLECPANDQGPDSSENDEEDPLIEPMSNFDPSQTDNATKASDAGQPDRVWTIEESFDDGDIPC